VYDWIRLSWCLILRGRNCEIKPKQVRSFMLGWVRSDYVVLGFGDILGV